VDTGAWIATAIRTDSLHQAAARAMRQLAASRTPLLTTDYVLSETLTRLRYDAGHQKAASFLQYLDRAISTGTVALVRVDDVAFAEARRIFLGDEDQDFSFVDCTSFAVAQKQKIEKAFAFDHHFATMGFTLIPGS
ncbi:MAG: PIN domain-containing protein, partial [Armatimonadetes bacterium]|nr:PIN domain-containing protein [Armatimonadota bacterium]